MNVNSATINASYHKYPLAWWACIVSLFLGAVLYLRMPVMGKTQTELDMVNEDLDTIQVNFREGSGMNEDLEYTEKLMTTFRSRLTDADQRARNIGYFDGFVSEYPDALKSIQLSGINQKPIVKENPRLADWNIREMKQYAVLPFEMRVSGLLTDILKMMYLLRQSNVILNYDSFELTTDNNREQGYMSMLLTVNTVAKPVSGK